MMSAFLGYFGLPDFHDAVIVVVQKSDSKVDILLRAENGREYRLSFRDCSVCAERPVGMRIYAVSMISGSTPGLTTYVFANSNENEGAKLEVTTACDPEISEAQ